MARIRTIKPEFFTSEDIFGMTPLARLFYVSLWCESDRLGRLEWKPGTFKARYLPADDCDINELGEQLVSRGLIILYEVDGKKYAEIPTFTEHQVINNRESPSTIPARVHHASTTRESAVKAEGKEGREGKGREGEHHVPTQSADEVIAQKPAKRQPSPDDEALAGRIFGLILDGNPTAKKPNMGAWADDIRLMREIDGRTLPDIWSMFQWVRRDTFWRPNVMCPSKLREKWDQLVEVRARAGVPARADPISDKFNFADKDRSGDERAAKETQQRHGITLLDNEMEHDL
jgi:hypothetical protein